MPISRIPGVGLDTGSTGIGVSNLSATGTASVNTFLRGDNAWAGTITSGTAVASTSGTSIDFTGIPSTAKRITVMFNGVSTNGASLPQIQLCVSGTPVTSGYTAYAAVSYGTSVLTGSVTSGFLLNVSGNASAATTMFGSVTITLINQATNTWAYSASTAINAGGVTVFTSGGAVSLSGTLNQVRITTVNGTDTFDAGTINIMWEG